MDALVVRLFLVVSVLGSLGATYRSPNFVVHASSQQLAREVAETAERSRDSIALDWLGKKLPRWWKPCVVTVQEGQVGAGGATSFQFDGGEVFGWKMRIQGSRERILDSVVPHEVSHTIFASYFRRPLPRWADEGAATLVEHESERRRQQLMLKQVFQTNRRIPLRKLFAMKEYPPGMQQVLTLYAQGYSLADYLVQCGGRKRYLQFLDDAHRQGWDAALQSNYGYRSVDDFETRWNKWVMAGSPQINLPEGQQLADASERGHDESAVIRSQNPDRASDPPGRSRGENGRPADREQIAAGDAQPYQRGQASGTPMPTASVKVRPVAQAGGLLGRSDGRVRAVNEGWSAMPESRIPRPEPLRLRKSFNRGSAEPSHAYFGASTADGGRKDTQPAAGRRIPVSRVHDDSAESTTWGEQQCPSRQSPHWSEFPQTRTGGGTTQLGPAIEFPSVP